MTKLKNKQYEKIRQVFREYRIFKKELEYRTKYIEDFRKILIRPLPKNEEVLHKIYKTIIGDMENTANKMALRLRLIENTINRLYGNEKNVMYYRYIEGIDWLRMPEYMMYEQRTCQLFEANAIKKIYRMNIDWENENVK